MWAFLIGCTNTEYVTTSEYKGCTLDRTDTHILVNCGPGGTEYMPIPENGTDGKDGGSFVSEIIDPCGDYADDVDEILLHLTDGTYLAWYKNTGLIVLEPGYYVTTDKQKCKFSIDTNGTYVEL